MKKFLLLLIFISMAGLSFADSISNYKVPNNVPLGKELTISGDYSNTTISDVLCSFFIYDVNNTDFNQLIERLDDQYTNSKGTFSARPYFITEPKFKRGIDYNAVTQCGTTETGKIFHVSQKEEIFMGISSQTIINDLLFWVDPENSVTVVFYFLLIIFVAAIFVGLAKRGFLNYLFS